MQEKWLTMEIDQKPYTYNKDLIDAKIQELDERKTKINHYFKTHPGSKRAICTSANRKQRFLDCAKSYLGLERNDQIDIIPVNEQTEAQKQKELQDVKRVLAYQEACEFIHTEAVSKKSWLDDNLLIKAHCRMCEGEEDQRLIVRPRFRNENDPVLIVGQGYFDPIPGELVPLRMNRLFTMYYNDWREDHPIVKGAKFAIEYIRIQPHMDGNKRIALMALNFILEKHDYPDIYIDESQRIRFFNAIKTGMLTRDLTNFIKLINENVGIRIKNRTDEIVDFRLKGFEKELMAQKEKNEELEQ